MNDLCHDGDFQFANLREDKCKTSSISPYWLLLDSESTTSVIKNRDLLSNIRDSSHPITCHSNGGTQVSSLVGRLKGFGDVWFNTESLANILSLAEMVNKYRVTFDSKDGNKFIIYKSDGFTVEFKQSIHGLYYHDIRWRRHNTKEFTLVSTVAANKENFTQRQIKNADVAVRLYKSICTPSHNDFISAVTKRLIKNCPISVEDAKNASEIYGPSIASLKSKTVRRSRGSCYRYCNGRASTNP